MALRAPASPAGCPLASDESSRIRRNMHKRGWTQGVKCGLSRQYSGDGNSHVLIRVFMTSLLRLRALAPSLRPLRLRPAHTTLPFVRHKMTSRDEFKQAPHKLLVIPGPIEVSDDVLYSNALPPVSHVSPDFIKVFGDAIRLTREVLFTKNAQPFLISGSGTLGWDQVSANLVEPGENALVLHSGYFGDSFADCLQTYGAKVDLVKAELGTAVSQSVIEEKLKAKKYKVLTVTHVDTSTGVLSDAKAVAETVRRVSPDTLVIVDGVCSVGSEEIRFDDWDLDVVLTASQKGLGTPPGLSIIAVSPRAMKVFETRKSPVTSYYASWKKWLPIMKAYEAGTPAYFATPPVNLIHAYHASLLQLTRSSTSLDERFKLHREASQRVKKAATELGLKQIALEPAFAANGMTTLYYPEGLGASDVLPRFAKRGLVIAGGLLGSIKDKYFRIGHMGVTVVDTNRGDIDNIIRVLQESIVEARSQKA
ncbi:PLP-dependent transferase [Lyophyllum atratum]|nr:PLP-dependent transferase [Lyophyllum atratum]